MKKKQKVIFIVSTLILFIGMTMCIGKKILRYEYNVDINEETILFMGAYSSWLQYALDEDGWNLWLQTAGKDKCLTRGGFFSQPCWSPDREFIAFTSYENTNPSNCLEGRCLNFYVWIMTSDCKIKYPITPPYYSAQEPDWSPDGEWIIMSAKPFNPDLVDISGSILSAMDKNNFVSSLYIMQPSDIDMKKIEIESDYPRSYINPSWAPDSKRAVCIGIDKNGPAIFIVNVFSNIATELLRPKELAQIRSPNWNPMNENLIAYVYNGNINIIEIKEKTIIQLTSDGWCREPSWRKDGERILFTRKIKNSGEQIWEININTLQEKQVTFLEGANVCPVGH